MVAPGTATGSSGARGFFSGLVSGMVSRLIAASEIIAATHPKAVMMTCASGTNTNWPNDPPALMKPEANERLWAGTRAAIAPIRIEKLPAPAPAALRRPIVTIRPHCESTNGVAAMPAAISSAPSMMMRVGPNLSATAPNTGCAAPHTNCPTASAKLIETMPSPVDVLIGEMKSPVDWRAPIVIIRIAAAASIIGQSARSGGVADGSLAEPDAWDGAVMIFNSGGSALPALVAQACRQFIEQFVQASDSLRAE